MTDYRCSLIEQGEVARVMVVSAPTPTAAWELVSLKTGSRWIRVEELHWCRFCRTHVVYIDAAGHCQGCIARITTKKRKPARIAKRYNNWRPTL